MLISIHIPKTAGTSFRELLADYYGEALCLFYGGLRNARMEPIAVLPAETRCLHGHMHATDFFQELPFARRIVWLRDPVQRVISEYEHHRRHLDPQNPLSRRVAQGCSLMEFATFPEAQNLQARVLQGRGVEDLDFVGISECFDLELDRFADETGVRLARGRRTNVNPAKTGATYAISASTRAALLRHNASDAALYRDALAAAGLSHASPAAI